MNRLKKTFTVPIFANKLIAVEINYVMLGFLPSKFRREAVIKL